MDVNEVLAKQNNFYKGNPVSVDQIKEAEQILGLSFADEYFKYLTKYGVASASGHEFTGLGLSERLDVVKVTKRIQDELGNTNLEMYVVEETNFEGIVVWQNHNGEIYETCENGKPKKIADSLAEYIAQ